MKNKFIFILVVCLIGIVEAQGLRRPNQLANRLNRNRPGQAVQPVNNQNDTERVEPGKRDIEFNATPVDLVFKVYGELINKTVIKDPKAPAATITLQPKQGQSLSDADKILAIETVLEMNGIHIEPYGDKFVRAIPRNNARKDGVPLIMDPDAELQETTRVVSFLLPFKNISTEDAQKTLDNFKSADGIIIGFERNNSLLITDTEANVNRMREIARLIDIATPVLENVFVRQVKNASAEEIKTALEAIVQESQKELEKAGNVPKQSNAQQRPIGSTLPGRRLLGRNESQPSSTANESVVMGVSDADRGMIRGKVLILADERSNKLIIITSKSNMDFFDKVIEALDIETTPDTVVKVYRLKYADSEDVSDMINDLIGNSTSSKNSSKGSQNANSKSGGGNANMTRGSKQSTNTKKPANQRSGEAKAGELSKENTTVLSDKRINGLVVMTDKELVPTVEQIIESMDIKLSQVLIETVIIEVTLGDDLKTGIDWIQNGRYRNDQTTQDKLGSHGLPMYWYRNDTTGAWSQYEDGTAESGWTKFGDTPIQETVSGALDKGADAGYLTGNAGYAQLLGGGANNGALAASAIQDGTTNLFSSAFNYMFTSDKLNLTAIIQASKTDSRTKYLASPIVMTVDNKEATIDATESRKFFSGYETSSSYSTYMRTPKYDSKDIGIKIKVTPKINPNGTVMLEIEEEYSQVIEGGQSILVGDGAGKELIDTSLQRKMSADALLENMQTVVLCGLTETYNAESESGIPFLKDIPYIGKWLFGSVSQKENRKELLIFMTPYVLNDAEEAQAKAIKLKKSLSDVRPWEDHGWSESKLADPVSKKEQMKRLKEEWKKQDVERQSRIAIELAKLERAEKLKAMSIEERKQWLELHKKELEEEAKEELEKKMLDEKSQEELKKLAEQVRQRKLKDAEMNIKKQDAEEAKRSNEAEKAEEESTQEPKKPEEPKKS